QRGDQKRSSPSAGRAALEASKKVDSRLEGLLVVMVGIEHSVCWHPLNLKWQRRTDGCYQQRLNSFGAQEFPLPSCPHLRQCNLTTDHRADTSCVCCFHQ